MSSIFLSHSSKDNASTKEIRDWLAALGYDDIFLDYDKNDGISPGTNWKSELFQALRRAQVFLALISRHWFTSIWCQGEYTNAITHGKSIIPVIIAPPDTGEWTEFKRALTARFGDVQYADVARDRNDGFARLEKILGRSSVTPLAFAVPTGAAPYKGLNAYLAEDKGLFFGRDRETQQTLETLRQLASHSRTERLLIIRGASGSGKSSLLRAGLLPQLSLRPREWLPLEPFVPESSRVRAASPLGAMAHALATSLISRDLAAVTASIEDELADDPRTLAMRLTALLRDVAGAPEATLVLPIDQGEEMLRASEEARARFLHALEAWLSAPGCLAVLTIRSDTLDDAQSLRVFERIAFLEYPLQPMPLGRIPEVIRGPARRVGLRVDTAFVDRVTEDAKTGDALPLLSFALWRLWRHYGAAVEWTLDRYSESEARTPAGERISPIENSVRLAAEEALSKISPEQEVLLGDAFVPGLVDLTDAMEPVRRRALETTMSEEVRALLRRLVEERLLTADAVDGQPTLEVAHEALFRRWPFLAERIEKARQDLRLIQDVKRGSENWDLELKGERLQRASRLIEGGGQWRERLAPYQDYIDNCLRLESKHDSERKAGVKQKQQLFAAVADELRRLGFMDGAMRVALAGEIDLESIERGAAQDPIRHAVLARAAHESRFVRQLPEHPGAVTCIAYSLDRKFIATGSHDGIARIFDAQSGDQKGALAGHEGSRWSKGGEKWVNGIGFSTDSKLAITGGRDGTVRIWDVATNEQQHILLASHEVRCVAIAPNGRLVAAGCNDGSIFVWDLKYLKQRRGQRPVMPEEHGGKLAIRHEKSVIGIAFSPDNRLLASCGVDTDPSASSMEKHSVAVWKLRGGWPAWRRPSAKELWKRSNVHRGEVWSVAFSPDGRHVASASYDGTAIVWNALSGTQSIVLNHQEQVRGIAYSPDGARIATTSYDSMVRVWASETGLELLTLGGHQNAVHCVAFAPSGMTLASGSYGRTVRIWDACKTSELARISGFTGDVDAIAVSPDGLWIAAGGPRDPVRLLEGRSGKSVQDLSAIFPAVQRLEFDGSGCLLLGVNPQGATVVASVRERNAIFRAPTHTSAAAIHPSGAFVATVGPDRVVRLYDTSTTQAIRELPPSQLEVSDVAFSRDGQLLATADAAGTIRIMHAFDEGATHSWFDSGLGKVRRLAFDPRSNRLAVAGCGAIHHLLFWELSSSGTWHMTLKVTTHEDQIWDIAFTGSGERIVTTCRDRLVRVFDARLGVITTQYPALPEQLRAIAVDPKGTFVVTGGRKGLLRVFDSVFGASLASQRLATVVAQCRIMGAQTLTPPEVERISQFADPPTDDWSNLSQRVAEQYPGMDDIEKQLLQKWHDHRDISFHLETEALIKGDRA